MQPVTQPLLKQWFPDLPGLQETARHKVGLTGQPIVLPPDAPALHRGTLVTAI